jgi:hypothetical protein
MEQEVGYTTAKGNFQVSQTAKAQLGLPCTVTPKN